MAIESREKVSSPSLKKSPDKAKTLEKSAQVEAARESGAAARVEALGFDESAETTGKVSEVLSEDVSENQGDSVKGQKKDDTATDIKTIKAKLLSQMPPVRKTVEDKIRKEIESEIKYLRKKARKMMRNPAEMNYFEMNNIMKKIRELRGLLKSLVKASIETLKTLWLRFVHGIM